MSTTAAFSIHTVYHKAYQIHFEVLQYPSTKYHQRNALDESDLPFPIFLVSHAVPAMVHLLLFLASVDGRDAALQAIGIIPKARQ